jgi:hypothetical protein
LKLLCIILSVFGLAQATLAADTLVDNSQTSPLKTQTVQTQDVSAPKVSALESNQSSAKMPEVEGDQASRLGTSYFPRPNEGRGSVRVLPSINSTLANAGSGENGEARSLDINSDVMETKLAFGVTKDINLEARFAVGTDTVNVGSQTSRRRGLGDFHFRATRLTEENTYDLFYGAELGLSPGRAAVASSGSAGDNRYSGGTQLSPFVGFQAQSIYEFNFGGQASLDLRTTRFFDDGTDKSGGHVFKGEGFIEKDYAPGTLGLMASLSQKVDDSRDQIGTLVPQTALGLGGYADFEINEQLFIPVQVNYTMGLANSADGVSYSKIDRVTIAAGAAYYF